MNLFFKIAIFMFCGGLFAGGCHDELDALESATNRYIEFINRLGGHDADVGNSALICAPDCKKIFNGKLTANSRDEFISQLIDLQNQGYHWAINPAEILFLPESRVAVLRLIIIIEKAEACTAIVILRYTPEFLVSEINEVFNRLGSKLR